MKRSMMCAAALGGLLLAGPARADDMKGMDMSTMAPSPAAAQTPADKAFEASAKSMMKGMGVKPTGNPDLDFVNMMMPHHQGAIDMARVELQYGKDPMLRKLAEDIVKAQESEIAEMKGWKAAHPK